jgi:xylulokinase
MNFLGIDIGTSSVKAVIVDGQERVLAEAAAPLSIGHPQPGWSEQEPEDWWRAVDRVVADLRATRPDAFAAVGSIGLSGQMHAALILDDRDRPIRPAMLWNDSRATAECAGLQAAVPDLAAIAGIIAMPGFTAPKLLWLRAHEPESVRRMARLLLPKDFIRLRLTGGAATDMTDAAGTLLLDEARRDWSEALLDAVGVGREMMPALHEGPEPSGTLRPEIAARWGLPASLVVATGGGDAAAGAVGIGAIEDGDRFISLGTSAQFFVTRDRYAPKPKLIHAFAHALPGRWFEMAAMLNGASCLDWAARLVGATDIPALLARVEARFTGPSRVLFLPYLSGERTPHNDPEARGAFAGLVASVEAEDLVHAVLEGVAFSLMDAQLALGGVAAAPGAIPVIGGGARSRLWLRIIAGALGLPVARVAGADKGPAFGAARLARMAVTGETASAVCNKPRVTETIEPDMALYTAYVERFRTFRALYPALKRANEIHTVIPAKAGTQ